MDANEDPQQGHRRPSVDSSPRRPNPHLRQRGQSSGSLLRLHAHRQDGHWNKQWDVALDALEQIETIYGPLSQYDYAENILFRNKNTPESIMEIQHTYTQGALLLHVQRGLHLPAPTRVRPPRRSTTAWRFPNWATRRPSGRRCVRTSISARVSSPKWARISRQVQHGMGIRGQDVQQHQHPPVVRTEVLVSRTCSPRPTATTTRSSAMPTRC